MAEGDSTPNFDSFPGAAPGAEKASESDEQFADHYRQAQAAIKKSQQEEQRKKAQDTSLAGVISAFLQDESRTPFFLLIARLVAQNVPSDLILATIALIYKPAADEIDTKLLKLPPGASALPVKKEANALFTEEEKQEIDAWTNGILRIAKTEPERVLRTVRGSDDVDAIQELIGLFALVLREFLEKRGHMDIEIDNLTVFGMAFFRRVFSALEKLPESDFLLEAV